MSIKISVITPVHNGLNFINRAITSVKNQTYSEKEMIIIDDASDEEIKGYIDLHFRDAIQSGWLKYYRNSERKERCFSRNFGVKQASGDVVTFLDHDDIFKPHHLSDVAAAFEQDSGLDFLYSVPEEYIDFNDQLYRYTNLRVKEEDLIRDVMSALMMSSGMNFRKESFERIGGFDLSITQREDYEISVRSIVLNTMRTKIIKNKGVQVRRLKSHNYFNRIVYKNDAFYQCTLIVQKKVEAYPLFQNKDSAKKYLPLLYRDVFNTAITYGDFANAYRILIKSVCLSPLSINYVYLLVRLLFKILTGPFKKFR